MSTKPKKSHRVPVTGSTFLSTVSICAVLFLIGLVAMIGLVGRGLGDYIRESLSYTVLLDPESTDADIVSMRNKISSRPYAKEVSYYSKEEAMQELAEELGESPEDVLGWNPLSPTLEVHVLSEYAASPDSIELVAKELQSFPIAQTVSYRKDLVDELNRNLSTIALIMGALALLLLVISVVLINNTIRLRVYAKRFIIYTMRLVGATGSFIRRPFIASGIRSGVVAAVVAIGLMVWCRYYLLTKYPILSGVLSTQNMVIAGAVVLVSGILISWIASAAAVSRYLKMDEDRLYRA